MLHLDSNKKYLYCLSNGFAVGVNQTGTIEEAIKVVEFNSDAQATTNFLHMFIDGHWYEVGKTYGLHLDYKFHFYKDFCL